MNNNSSIPADRPPSPSGSISSLFNDDSNVSSSCTAASNGVIVNKEDRFLDSVLENSNSSVLQTPTRRDEEDISPPPPPTSPPSGVWIPELSLSSFLNLGESPAKLPRQTSSSMVPSSSAPQTSASSAHLLNEDSSHSTNSEVDRQLLSMMTENSVDFTMKFAKLASHVSDGDC